MNAITSFPVPDDSAQWEAAYFAVNAWRGHLIFALTQADAAVSETLLTLSRVEKRGAHVKLRQMYGDKVKDLATALAPTGPFAPEGKNALAAVNAFIAYTELRVALCHGGATVSLDRRGRWTVQLKLTTFTKAREADRSKMVFDQAEGEALGRELADRSATLRNALREVRALVAQAK